MPRIFGLPIRGLQLCEESLHVPQQQGPEGSRVCQNDAKLSRVNLRAIGVPDDMAESAQVVEKRHGFSGDGGRPDSRHRDAHPPKEGGVIAGVRRDVVLAGIRDDLEQPFRRAVEVVQLKGQALEAGGAAHTLALVDAVVDGDDLEELGPKLRLERYVPPRVHLSPVRRIDSAK